MALRTASNARHHCGKETVSTCCIHLHIHINIILFVLLFNCINFVDEFLYFNFVFIFYLRFILMLWQKCNLKLPCQ